MRSFTPQNRPSFWKMNSLHGFYFWKPSGLPPIFFHIQNSRFFHSMRKVIEKCGVLLPKIDPLFWKWIRCTVFIFENRSVHFPFFSTNPSEFQIFCREASLREPAWTKERGEVRRTLGSLRTVISPFSSLISCFVPCVCGCGWWMMRTRGVDCAIMQRHNNMIMITGCEWCCVSMC